jgi:hypothetical protein
MTRTSPLRWVLNGLMAVAMLVVGTMATDRATAHAATHAVHAVMPPCHMAAHEMDHLAPQPVNACDTICAGSAPESSYDAVPSRIDFALPMVVFAMDPVVPFTVHSNVSPAHYGHGPPPPSRPAYLRNRRLLI